MCNDVHQQAHVVTFTLTSRVRCMPMACVGLMATSERIDDGGTWPSTMPHTLGLAIAGQTYLLKKNAPSCGESGA